MKINAIIAWMRQPTSVAGLATICGTLTAALAHQLSWAAATPVLIGAAIGVALPDNSHAKTDATKLASDAVKAVESPSAGATASVVADVSVVATDLAPAKAA